MSRKDRGNYKAAYARHRPYAPCKSKPSSEPRMSKKGKVETILATTVRANVRRKAQAREGWEALYAACRATKRASNGSWYGIGTD